MVSIYKINYIWPELGLKKKMLGKLQKKKIEMDSIFLYLIYHEYNK